MSKLTPKQEKFCLAYLTAKDASEAYCGAYGAGKNKPETINRMAFRLMQLPKICARINSLRAEAARSAIVTVHDLVEELEESRQLALSKLDATTAIAATMGKAKLLGFGSESNLTINNIPMVLNIQPVKPMERIDA